MPDGVSAELKVLEMSDISSKNGGLVWGGLSFLYCSYQYLRIKLNLLLKR